MRSLPCQTLLFLQAGVRAARPEHKWVLCLDDDIELHPRSLADLVAAAEADPHVFMATGEAPGHARRDTPRQGRCHLRIRA